MTLNQINHYLHKNGVPEEVELVKGKGYFYFIGGDTHKWFSSSIYAYSANQLTYDWVLDTYKSKEKEFLLGESMKNNVITIQEDIQIGDIILEKGDKIKVIEEASSHFGKSEIAKMGLTKLQLELANIVAEEMGTVNSFALNKIKTASEKSIKSAITWIKDLPSFNSEDHTHLMDMLHESLEKRNKTKVLERNDDHETRYFLPIPSWKASTAISNFFKSKGIEHGDGWEWGNSDTVMISFALDDPELQSLFRKYGVFTK